MKSIIPVILALGLCPASYSQPFTRIDYPGATATAAWRINDTGQIVGHFTANNVTHGFLLSAGEFTEINYPGARQTWVYGNNNDGDIVGNYDAGAGSRGFLLHQGEFTTLECPDSVSFSAYDINNSGDVAGWVNYAARPAKGAVWSRGVCTLSEYHPEDPRRTMTMYWGLNDAGVTVGHWRTNGGAFSHGIVYNRGTFTPIMHGGGGWVDILGINNAGDIVGFLAEVSGAGAPSCFTTDVIRCLISPVRRQQRPEGSIPPGRS